MMATFCGCKCGCQDDVRVSKGYAMMFCQPCGVAWSAGDSLHGPLSLYEVLEAHRRFHGKVGCAGLPECYVCVAENKFSTTRNDDNPDAPDALTARVAAAETLVAKWRQEAERLDEWAIDTGATAVTDGPSTTLDNCADELAAALGKDGSDDD